MGSSMDITQAIINDPFVPISVPVPPAKTNVVLSGLLVSWKDVFPLCDHTSRAGTTFVEIKGTMTHPLIRRLGECGAAFAGFTQSTELSFSVLGENEASGSLCNPWSEVPRLAGGSSVGSALSVVEGRCGASIGTDSGGSVRLPAAWCGLVGFKPTQNRAWSDGTIGFSESLDTVGILGRDIATVERIYRCMNPSTDSHTAPNFQIPTMPQQFQVEAGVTGAWQETKTRLEMAGISVSKFSADIFAAVMAHRKNFRSLANLEGSLRWRETILTAGNLPSKRLRDWAANQPCAISLEEIEAIVEARNVLIREFNNTMGPNTILIMPTSPILPPLFSDIRTKNQYDSHYCASHAYLWPFNELDAPAIVLPTGWTKGGLPTSIQLAAAQGEDALLLKAAEAVFQILTHKSKLK